MKGSKMSLIPYYHFNQFSWYLKHQRAKQDRNKIQHVLIKTFVDDNASRTKIESADNISQVDDNIILLTL